MIVYDYFRSSASFRLRIALNLKGLTPEWREVHLLNGAQRESAYRAINPQGLVPFLMDDEIALGQSLAIVEYLDERYPDPPLLPSSRPERAMARQIAQMIACDIHPLNNTRVLGYIVNALKADDDAKARWYCHWIREGFTAIETLLARRPRAAPFCIGDSPSLADICLIPQVVNAQRFHCALDAFPLIQGIHDHAMQLPAFADAHPAKKQQAS